jgi:magnesium transporter
MATRIEILRDFDRARIDRMRQSGEFFWADLDDSPSPKEIVDAFGIEPDAVAVLTDLSHTASPARRLHVESDLIVFAFSCATNPEAPAADPTASLGLERVNVVVHGDFLLTCHRGTFDLARIAAPDGIRVERSEHYAVYAILDGMVNTMLDAMASVEGDIAMLEQHLWGTGWRQRPSDQAMVRTLRSRLTELRLKLGPEYGLFERIAQEIERIPTLTGDDHDYFERIRHQLEHAVERVDAAGETLANAVQVQLNETTYRLTIVATIFLPLSFVAGFFGMNFAWMVENIDSPGAFWLLGVGVMVMPLIVFALIVRLKRS